MATQAAFNPKNGNPLYKGETVVWEGITYTGSTPKATSSATSSTKTTKTTATIPKTASPTPAAFNALSGKPLYVGETVTKDGITYTGTTPKPTTSTSKIKSPTTASTTSTSTSLLKQGTTSDEVKSIQQQLGITADGSFGPQTKSAIMAFQQANGLTVDGIVGPETRAALAKMSSGTSSGTPETEKPADDPSYKYNKETGQPNSKYTEIDNINSDANAQAEKDVLSFSESLGEGVDVSESSKLIQSFIDSYEEKNNNKEDTASLTEQLATKRAELKVDEKETELNTIDAQIAKLDSEWSSLQDTEDNRQVSMSQINRRKSAEQITYEKTKNDLINQRNSLANEINQKYNVINTYMQYAEKDYDNAVSEYNTDFSQALSMINLIKNVEDSAKSDAEKKTDNSKANLQLMFNMLKDKSVDYGTIDSATQAEIKKLELQSGLPSGFTEFALSAVDEPVISIGSEFTDASGNRQVPVYTKDASTGLVTAKVITIGTGKTTSEADDQEEDIAAIILDFKDQIKKNKWRGINPDAYEYYKEQIKDQYGSAAVLKLDKAIKDAKLEIDDENFGKREI